MAGLADRTESTGTGLARRPRLTVEMPLVLISYLRRSSAYTSILALLEALRQNGIPVVIMTGDEPRGPICFPPLHEYHTPILMVCWASHIRGGFCSFTRPISGPGQSGKMTRVT